MKAPPERAPCGKYAGGVLEDRLKKYAEMRGKMDKVAVLIPCYNEEKTIYKVVTDARKALPEAVVYVYDNNSTDKTIEEATRAGAVVRHEYMQGKGNVIRRMFREIQAEERLTPEMEEFCVEYIKQVDAELYETVKKLWKK